MKRRIVSLVLFFAFLISLSPVYAKFNEVRSYTPGYFTDVSESDWSAPYIRQVYELGLMDGTAERQFSPKGTVSVAQVVTVAVRLNDLYSGDSGIVSVDTGANWYDAAVKKAISLGIISEGQFDNYERTASRAEVAGTLAHALPASEFAPVRSINNLPDVNSATPYAADIFMLYNAGILCGNDSYGTYTPNVELTREALAAILCRVCKSETRSTEALAPKPPDLTAYTSSKVVLLSGVPLYGAVVIDEDYYLPISMFQGNESLLHGAVSAYSDEKNTLSFKDYAFGRTKYAPDYCLAPPNGVVLGTAKPAPDYNYNGRTVRHMTLGGRYHMFRLSDVGGSGFSVQSDRVIVPLEGIAAASPALEDDLPGRAVTLSLRGTQRETVKAIHDYLVNTLTYELYTDASFAAEDAASEKYHLANNVTLESRYAICEKYSCLFMEMCIRAGIPCEYVVGEPDHAWNRVWIDGQWLYVDVTWDDPSGSKPVLRYDYFLVGADVMVNGHYWKDNDYPFPTTYDPAWEKLDPQNITSADMFRKCLCAQAMMGVNPVRLRVTKSGAYGGIACLYAISDLVWWSVRGGYDSSTGEYVYYFDE